MVAELFALISHPQIREILLGSHNTQNTNSCRGSDDSEDSASAKGPNTEGALTLNQLQTMQEIMLELEARIREDSCAGDWKPDKIVHVLATVFGDLEQNQQELVQLLNLQRAISESQQEPSNEQQTPGSPERRDAASAEYIRKLESGFQVNVVQRAMLIQVVGELVKILLMNLSRAKVGSYI